MDFSEAFGVVKINKEESPNKVIEIHLKYLPKNYNKKGKTYKLYDTTPERKWQHLSWFDYKCYIVCRLPRFIDLDGKVKVIDISFASKNRGYTHLFSQNIIESLQTVRVQKTVADLYGTTPYTVRTIVENTTKKPWEIEDK